MLKKKNDLVVFLIIFCAGFSFFIVTPANSGSDENWYAKNSWYLSENITKIFDTSGMIYYSFPDNLVLDGKIHGEAPRTPCWWNSRDIQSKCQNLNKSNGFTVEHFDRVTRAPIYQLIIGKIMHYPFWQNNYETGRLASFLLSMLLIFGSILNISKSKYRNSVPFVLIALTPTWYFLASGINPTSHEISLGILFASLLVRLEPNIPNRKLENMILAVILIFGLSRPLAPIWCIMILFFYSVLFERISGIKKFLTVASMTFLVQLTMDSGTWRYGDGSPAPYIAPSPEFYVEELIRTILNSGDWIWQSFGNLRIGSSVELPLIFLFAYLIAIWHYLSRALQNFSNKYAVSLFLLFGYFLLPLALALSRSNNWPGWWSGRYQMPLLCAFMLLIAIKNDKFNKVGIIVTTITIVSISSVLNFVRWNWGLFPTYTPIVSNGWSLDPIIIAVYFLSLLLFALFSTQIILQIKNRKLEIKQIAKQ